MSQPDKPTAGRFSLVPTLRVGTHARAALRREQRTTWRVPTGAFPRGAFPRRAWERGSCAPRRRTAITLLEVLLTLCLLVILASLTWPALGRPMAAQRLRESAEQIRAEWVRARVQAMSTGQVHVFRYLPSGGNYFVDIYPDADEAALGSPGVNPIGTADPTMGGPAGSFTQSHVLAGKIHFAANQGGVTPDAQIGLIGNPSAATVNSAAALANSPLGPMASTGDPTAPPPVLFNVDGSCTDAQVWLENEYGARIGLTLRGLTGVVTVGQVQ